MNWKWVFALTCWIAASVPSSAAADTPSVESSRVDVTLGAGLYDVAIDGYEVSLLALDLDLRYAHPSAHGVVARAWAAWGVYGFGGIDLGYLHRLRLLKSGTNRVVLDLMVGPTIASGDGCDEDSSTTECYGPYLVGIQSGAFVSPSISFHGGPFTAKVSLNYRFLRDHNSDLNSRFLGLLVGIGLGG